MNCDFFYKKETTAICDLLYYFIIVKATSQYAHIVRIYS
uniref:Uncharacterized protein n=2 Tax=Enterobacteriaceae TaxID=543 RepID=W0FXW9_ECOLX|nr:hypothetical protein [Escherichia coli]AVX35047.1 Hypothetical protein [Klebsiella aerogenes]